MTVDTSQTLTDDVDDGQEAAATCSAHKYWSSYNLKANAYCMIAQRLVFNYNTWPQVARLELFHVTTVFAQLQHVTIINTASLMYVTTVSTA